MKRKILIEKSGDKVRTFILENDEIAEIHCAPLDISERNTCTLGDIYIGKVSNIVENIGAAFIEIGGGINCYYDMKDVSSAIFTRKFGKKPLCIGDELVVQISKEAVRTKAPTVTGNISFAGRYTVLTHGNTRIGVSSKLPRKRKDEYKEKLKGLQNEAFGIIVRTNARDVSFDEVLHEIQKLKEEYETLKKNAMTRVCFSCLKSAPPSYISDLKNVYMEGMEAVIVSDPELYTNIQSYFETEMPEKLNLLRLYDNPSFPLGKLYGTDTALEKALREKVWLKNG